MGGNVRYAAFARLSDGLTLASFKGKGATNAVTETAHKVLRSGNLKPNGQLTVTVDRTIGTLHLAAGDGDVLAVITAPDYPRRSAFKLLDEIREMVRAGCRAEDVGAATREGELQSAVPTLASTCRRYEDLGEVDKLTAVSLQVEEVKATMEGNINKMLDNAETVGAVEDKAEALRDGAQQFQRRSDNIKRAMWWRLFKIKLIFGLLFVVVLGYIFIPIIVKASEDSENK
mmetsp:Transcript_9566/g.38754  ORF Transcript_9566/g.38754 Transcript_9566/m.38754 type:complete len:230 (+) Transcript_9566:222-911(+)